MKDLIILLSHYFYLEFFLKQDDKFFKAKKIEYVDGRYRLPSGKPNFWLIGIKFKEPSFKIEKIKNKYFFEVFFDTIGDDNSFFYAIKS